MSLFYELTRPSRSLPQSSGPPLVASALRSSAAMVLQGAFAWLFFGQALSARWRAGAACIAAGTALVTAAAEAGAPPKPGVPPKRD